MIAQTSRKQWTDEELMALPDDGHKYELLDGELVSTPAGFEHGDVSVSLLVALTNHVRRRRLGRVADSSTGFRMRNGNVLSPDVSFVAKERFQGMTRLPQGFFQGAPDLAIEVLSPGERKTHMERKLKDYFSSGARLCWLINLREQHVAVHRGVTPVKLLKLGETLEGEEVVPGFTMAVSALFEPFP